jgi:hypothetical protein
MNPDAVVFHSSYQQNRIMSASATSPNMARRLQFDTERISSLGIAFERLTGYLETTLSAAIKGADEFEAGNRFRDRDDELDASIKALRSQCRQTVDEVRMAFARLRSVTAATGGLTCPEEIAVPTAGRPNAPVTEERVAS